MSSNDEKQRLINLFLKYRNERKNILKTIEREKSNRDPLCEFAEKIASVILDARRAENPVQKGFDMIDNQGKKIDVKFLSNPKDSWVNWHVIYASDLRDQEALVYYEDLEPKFMFVFELERIGKLTKALGKRHKDLDTSLQFTKTDYIKLTSDPKKYKEYGVKVFDLRL
jgi:hypothetical protein